MRNLFPFLIFVVFVLASLARNWKRVPPASGAAFAKSLFGGDQPDAPHPPVTQIAIRPAAHSPARSAPSSHTRGGLISPSPFKEASMFKGIPVLIFFVILILGAMVSFPLFLASPPLGVLGFIASFLLAILASSAVRVAAQWERGLVLRLGKFSCIKGPGIFFIIPIVDNVALVDTRVLTLDIPTQQVITKDNVPVSINGVVYFKVSKVDDAIIKVQNYTYAMSQYALAALRDVVGGMTLDQLLSEREQICTEIEKIVEKESQNWGLDVTAIKIQDIDMPEELKKMMSRQASAEREKRATITKAEGDKLAAVNLAAAADTMIKSPGAMQLRTLQTIDGLGPSSSNTVVLAIPLDVMESFKAVVKKTGE